MKHHRLTSVLLVLSLCGSGFCADVNAPIDAAAYKPPIRVACLGDSITYGVGAEPGWAWPDQLDRMLGEAWDVRNFGHSGASVAKEEKHTIWSQKEYSSALLLHPDVVIILLGTNDTKPDNWAKKGDFPKLYKELVASFQKLSSKPRVFCGTAPYVGKKGNFGINEAGVKEQIPMIEAVAKELGAGVIDVHGALDGKDELLPDNVHPKTEGATLIAKAAYKALTRKDWEGAIPAPKDVKKRKPSIRTAEEPGALSYREAFMLIVLETRLPAEQLARIRGHFEVTSVELDGKVADLEAQIEENDGLRMKFKYSDPPLAGEYKAKVGQLKKELVKLQRDSLCDLIALIPDEHKAGFAAGWLRKYVLDRLTPIAVMLTPEQRKRIREICDQKGPVVGRINNTPERSVEEVETYKAVYATVLDDEQRKRVEPK